MKNVETYSIKEDMRADLMNCYREVAPDCLYQYTAWERTVRHPAKEFYITAKQVYQRLNGYLNGNPWLLEGMRNKLKQQLYYDILEVIKDLSQKVEYQGYTLMALCKVAVKMPAPRFYITEENLCLIFHRIVGREYDKNGMYIKQKEIYKKTKDFNRAYNNKTRGLYAK